MSNPNWVVMRYGRLYPHDTGALYVDWYDTEQDAVDAAKECAKDSEIKEVDVLEIMHTFKASKRRIQGNQDDNTK